MSTPIGVSSAELGLFFDSFSPHVATSWVTNSLHPWQVQGEVASGGVHTPTAQYCRQCSKIVV